MFTVYVLYSPVHKKTYVGFTSNMQARLQAHNELDKKGWTAKFRPWILLHTEVFEEKKHALHREKDLKTGKGRDFIKTLLQQ